MKKLKTADRIKSCLFSAIDQLEQAEELSRVSPKLDMLNYEISVNLEKLYGMVEEIST